MANMQDFTGKKTWLDDWTAQLAAVGRTISTATVTATGGALVTNTSPTTTGVRFRLDATPISNTAPVNITVTTTATLDNGDIDARHYVIEITNL